MASSKAKDAVISCESTMQKPQKTFCSCCSLKTGTLNCGVVCLLFSTMVIVTNALQLYPDNYGLDRSVLCKGVIGFITSAFVIHGAVKENRYSLLPWLLAAAVGITFHVLTASYFILYGDFEISMVGLIIMAGCGLFIYWWMCVANYYTELRDRAHSTDSSPAPARDYINPSAVTNPDAFTTPPPAYNVAVEGEEKPPRYEEAAQATKQPKETV